MQELRARGITILMTTHEPEVALAVADDVLLVEFRLFSYLVMSHFVSRIF
jgi:ABC-type Mn2+/Zn2+ transport system ATPase subunit